MKTSTALIPRIEGKNAILSAELAEQFNLVTIKNLEDLWVVLDHRPDIIQDVVDRLGLEWSEVSVSEARREFPVNMREKGLEHQKYREYKIAAP